MEPEQRFINAVHAATFIPGMIWPRETFALKDLVFSSTHHIEVGCFCGKSLWITAAAMCIFGSPDTKKRITLVDSLGDDEELKPLIPGVRWWRTVLQATIREVEEAFGIEVRLLEMPSPDAACALTGEQPCDSIYIDANHHQEFVSQDIVSWWAVLKDGGLMLGHDYSADRLGVMNAVNQAFQDHFEVTRNTRIWFATKDPQTSSMVEQFGATI